MNVKSLPAVIDANSSTGVFRKAVGRETGIGGATPSGCFKVTFIVIASLGAGVFCGVTPIGWGFILGTMVPRSYADMALTILPSLGALLGMVFFVLVTWGVYVLMSKLMHPNVSQAQSILKTGKIPLDKIGPALQAREPSTAEQQRIDDAVRKLSIHDKFFFDGWFVLPSSHPYALTFGSYLFLSRGAIEGNSLDKVIAHELGHLNNGDSFVKCALWTLGKGWTREYMSLAGNMVQPEKGAKTDLAGVGTIGHALINRNWEVAVAEATLMAVFATGSSLKGMEEDLRAYFWTWDVEADAVAEWLVGIPEYQAYLKNLAQFENGVGTLPLSAPAELRYDRSFLRQSNP